jgi:hypothetical protein
MIASPAAGIFAVVFASLLISVLFVLVAAFFYGLGASLVLGIRKTFSSILLASLMIGCFSQLYFVYSVTRYRQ